MPWLTAILAFMQASGWAALARAQWTEPVTVQHAAYLVPGAPSALVHAPASFDPTRPLHLVVFLNGFMGCAEVLMREGSVACKPGGPLLAGWNLAQAHDSAGTSTLFVIPQLAFMKRNGQAGCFARAECFRSFLQELLSALPIARLQAHKTLADVASITLVAHSAGYRAALAVLEHGQVQALVHDVVLLDALYGEQDRFFSWVAVARKRPVRLISLHIGAGKPAQHSAQLLRMARRRLGSASATKLSADLDEPSFSSALLGKRVVIAHVEVEHRLVPEAYLGRVLRALERADAQAEPK